ncbi:hypothetical protein [Chitinophaga cymbidii]|uniref:Uncharacterized protein n=1 Tax=Chitinophaga cymbidii TaxID=1096750 RepID=A0A512RNF8_9BACT|nr:hypothetical protein [Chitinophaga cymbidii]GEP97234.1 hypothetical protein CCY01nite_34940 [Chitinophaga cymbidii]
MPSSKSLPAQFAYALKAAKETRFLFNSLEELQLQSIDISKVRNEYYHKWKYDRAKEEFGLDFRVVFKIKEQVFIDYGVQVLFKTSGLSSNKIPELLLLNFYGIAIATIRGMLVVRLAGSDYPAIFVPIFHPSDIRELFLHA